MEPRALDQVAALKPKKSDQYLPAKQAVGLLLLILIANVALGFPAAGNLAFLAPVTIATYRGGLKNGLPVFVLTSVASAMLLAYSGLIQHGGLVNNVVIEAALLIAAMIGTEKTRRNLLDTIDRSRFDELTNALNRTSIADAGIQAVRRTVASGQPMSVAVLDLDDFKELNDGHGHAFGDAVLKQLVETLTESLAPTDQIGRTGGDEFVVVLPNRTLEETEDLLRRASHSFADRTLVHGYPISFSYGIGTPASDGFSWTTLLDVADLDMYRRKSAKKKGSRLAACG